MAHRTPGQQEIDGKVRGLGHLISVIPVLAHLAEAGMPPVLLDQERSGMDLAWLVDGERTEGVRLGRLLTRVYFGRRLTGPPEPDSRRWGIMDQLGWTREFPTIIRPFQTN